MSRLVCSKLSQRYILFHQSEDNSELWLREWNWIILKDILEPKILYDIEQPTCRPLAKLDAARAGGYHRKKAETVFAKGKIMSGHPEYV